MDTVNRHLEIEKDLDKILSPIQPSNDFVDDLNQKLRAKSRVVVEYPNYFLPIVVLSSGLFIGIAVFWVLKMVLSFITPSKKD